MVNMQTFGKPYCIALKQWSLHCHYRLPCGAQVLRSNADQVLHVAIAGF